MSATDSRVAQSQREIQGLHKKIADESATCAKERDRIIKARNSVQRTSSAATRASVERTIAQAEANIQKAEKRRADHEKALASKVGDLYKAQGKQADERLRSQQDALKRLEASTRSRQQPPPANWPALAAPLRLTSASVSVPSPRPDLFVAHAGEDKDEVARPLAEALRGLGLQVWFDEFELRVGSNLRRRIDEGLARCRFGVPILSPDFFAKEWPQRELDGLATRAAAEGGEIILPVWHRVSMDEVMQYSPPLANLFALKTANDSIATIAAEIAEVARGDPEQAERGPA